MTYVPQNQANLVVAAAARAEQHKRRRRWRPRWDRMTRRTLILVAVGTVVPVGGAVYAVVREAIPTDHVENPVGRGPDRAPLARPSAALVAGYARLGQPASADDRDNGELRRWATHSRAFGLDPTAARLLTRIDGKRLWLVPGNGYACLALQEPDGLITAGCATEMVALRDGIQANDTEAIYGVLPDGIDRIEVTDDRDGYRHTEPVDHNAYVLKNASATIRYTPRNTVQPQTFRVIGSGG
jgi:hypothetical protein